MKSSNLQMLIFMAFCCTLGLVTKKLINPFANIISDALHIPGGLSAGFSIMFLIIAAELGYFKGAGTLMGLVQGLLALVMGRVGSMGAFMPIGYLMPGIAMDLIYLVEPHLRLSAKERMVIANSLTAVTASAAANCIVFHLSGVVLALYLSVSAFSGAIYGMLGHAVVMRLQPALGKQKGRDV